MCSHRVLAHNENGYVVECRKCNSFQIGFGTMVVCLSPEQFVEFKAELEIQHSYWQYCGFPNQKNVQLPTFNNNTYLMLTLNELVRLRELIESSLILTEVDKILKFSSQA